MVIVNCYVKEFVDGDVFYVLVVEGVNWVGNCFFLGVKNGWFVGYVNLNGGYN